MNILEFLGLEEQNLLTTLMKVQDELNFLNQFDALFQLLINEFSLNSKEDLDVVIFSLMTFIHTHYYISVICLLRGRFSENFSSTRGAIEAALTMYKIVYEPSSVTDYLEGNQDFKNIKNHLKKMRKEDASRYPLAEPLIKAHEFCSGYGPHADFRVFFNRLKTKKEHAGNIEIKEAQVHFFQYPEQDEDLHKFFLWTFQYYYHMFKLSLDCVTKRTDLTYAIFKTSIEYIDREHARLKNIYIKTGQDM